MVEVTGADAKGDAPLPSDGQRLTGQTPSSHSQLCRRPSSPWQKRPPCAASGNLRAVGSRE